MIDRLNQRDTSPAKRQRADSGSVGSAASDEESVPDEQWAPFMRVLQRELRKQTDQLTTQFRRITDSMMEKMQQMQQRIGEVEDHLNTQGETIRQLQEAVGRRDEEIWWLQDQLEGANRRANLPYLMFEGPGVPEAPREERWKEDVPATVRGMLDKFVPQVKVRDEDIVCANRRGKQIECQFVKHGPASVREKIYQNRMNTRFDENGQVRDNGDQIYVNEKLTEGAAAAVRTLRAEKKAGRIQSVHTKNGVVVVRSIKHGAKRFISNGTELQKLLTELRAS